MASLMIPGSKLSDIRGCTSCFTAGLVGYGAGATMAMLTQPRPGRRVLAPRGCGFGVDDPTGVPPDHRRLPRHEDPGEVLGEDPDVVHRVAAEYTRLRAHKGMTEERAAEIVSDVSSFGTNMVHPGCPTGWSAAPRTPPRTPLSRRSRSSRLRRERRPCPSVFLMCLSDRDFVHGDGAANPDPTAEHLPGIAIRARQRTGTPGGTLGPPRRAAYPPPFRRTAARRGYRARR